MKQNEQVTRILEAFQVGLDNKNMVLDPQMIPVISGLCGNDDWDGKCREVRSLINKGESDLFLVANIIVATAAANPKLFDFAVQDGSTSILFPLYWGSGRTNHSVQGEVLGLLRAGNLLGQNCSSTLSGEIGLAKHLCNLLFMGCHPGFERHDMTSFSSAIRVFVKQAETHVLRRRGLCEIRKILMGQRGAEGVGDLARQFDDEFRCRVFLTSSPFFQLETIGGSPLLESRAD